MYEEIKEIKDIEPGTRFNSLIAIEFAYRNNGQTYWIFKCDCGNKLITKIGRFKSSIKKSCGNCKKLKSNKEDKVETFQSVNVNYLTNIKSSEYPGYSWFKCVCKKEQLLPIKLVESGKIKSCGCIRTQNTYYHYEEIDSYYFSSLKWSAKTRRINFDVTIEEIWDVFIKQNRRCALTGEILLLNKNKERLLNKDCHTASLDRVDSSKGYTIDNIRWVHKDINIMRRNHSDKYFIELCHKVSEYQKQKQTESKSEDNE